MKYIFLFIFLICYGSSFSAPSDSLKVKRKKLDIVLKAEILGPSLEAYTYYRNSRNGFTPFLREWLYSFSAEALLLQNQSVQLTYMGYNATFNYNSNFLPAVRRNWFVIAPEYKLYVSQKKVCSGYYIGANIKYIRLSNQDGYSNSNSSVYSVAHSVSQSIGAGFITGCQFYIKEGFTFDFVLGLGFLTEVNYSTDVPPNAYGYYSYFWRNNHVYDFALNNTVGSPSLTHADIRLGINIGYHF